RALVVDAAPRARHDSGHIRGAQGAQPGHTGVLRGHGARGAGKRRPARVSPAPLLAHGLPAGAPQPGGAGRRLRALRVVLRLQAAPPPRRGPPPAADGGRPAPDVAGAPRPRRGSWPGSSSSAARIAASTPGTPGSIEARSLTCPARGRRAARAT